MTEQEIKTILDGHKIQYVDNPTFYDPTLIKKEDGNLELIPYFIQVGSYHVEGFLKLLESPYGIEKIFIFKNDDEVLWTSHLMNHETGEFVQTIRGNIQIKNKRYSFKNNLKLCQQEN